MRLRFAVLRKEENAVAGVTVLHLTPVNPIEGLRWISNMRLEVAFGSEASRLAAGQEIAGELARARKRG